MQIKIALGQNIMTMKSYVRVDYYKSIEAYNDPIEYPEQCFTSCTELNSKDFKITDLVQIIENSVNSLLLETL